MPQSPIPPSLLIPLASGGLPLHALSIAVVMLSAALVGALLVRRVGLPSVVGYLLAGVLIGPVGLADLGQDGQSLLTEVAVVLLMFVVGLELSPRELLHSGSAAAWAGVLQMIGTTLVATLPAWLLTGNPVATGIVAATVAFSSTAIVVLRLAERNETDSATGRLLIITLLLQDLAVLAFLIIMPMLAVEGTASSLAAMPLRWLAWTALPAAALVLPRLVPIIAVRGGRELLAVFAVMAASLAAWASGKAGWSPALGAFVAGLVLAGSDARHQLAAEILPFRDVFSALFFIAMGMSLDLQLVARQPGLLIGGTLAVLVMKALVAGGAARLTGAAPRIAAGFALGLAPMSEFALVVSSEAARLGLLPAAVAEQILAIAAGSMVLGALLIAASPRMVEWAAVLDRPVAPPRASDPAGAAVGAGRAAGLSGHVVVIGYGLNGRNLSTVLRSVRIPFCVVEMNRRLMLQAIGDGCEHVVLGDACRSWILEHAAFQRARVMVVAINDIEGVRRIVAQAHRQRPELHIIARSRFVAEIETLYRLGAKLVIPEEFETSIELFAHTLQQFGVADNIIRSQIEMIRAGRYRMLRDRDDRRSTHAEMVRALEATATQTYQIEPGSPAIARSLRDLEIRGRTGVTVIAVVRGGKPTTSPPPDQVLVEGDVLVLVGPHAGLEKLFAMLAAPVAPPAGAATSPG